ncbi:MAG: ABC transporter substrate-binding protein [Reyranellaceae bacterium]
MHRRSFSLGLAGLGSLLASGPAAAETPRRGGKLSIVLQLTTASLDPIYANTGSTDPKFYNLFAERLIYQGKDLEFVPWLAESWEYQKGDTVLVFRLRRDVRFQDGTPMDAEAVKFSLDRLGDPALKATVASRATEIASIEVVDPHTVRINLKTRSGRILATLADTPGSILSPTAIRERGADFRRNPVGTGPFIAESWSGNKFTFRRNPSYWRPGADGKPMPYVDNVEINVNPNSAVRLVELGSGNAHIIDGLQPKDFAQIEKNAKVGFIESGQGVHQHLCFNVTRPPFDNIELRKAIALGIDRAALAKVIAPTVGRVLGGFETEGDGWVYDGSVKGHVFDKAKAREAYEKSGYKGPPLLMSLIQRDPDTQVAQMIQSMLKAAGIDIKIEVLERQAYADKVVNHRNEFALQIFTHSGSDPDTTYTNLYDKKGYYDLSGFDREETTKLVEQARVLTDRSARRKIYNGIDQWALDNYYFSWLYWYPNRAAASKQLRDLRIGATGAWMYDTVWIAS